MNDVTVLVTGLAWMGGGVRSIESALNELLQSAQNEVLITAYTISNISDRVSGKLEIALSRGATVHLIVNRLNTQPKTAFESLKSLGDKYPYFHMYSFESDEESADLHAKAVVIDRKRALIGSANISFRGWTTNHELAVLITGPAAGDIARAIDRLRFSKFCYQVE
ncbi:MAG: phospholipase D-like domain-containing protein [Chloroflexota bacterium]